MPMRRRTAERARQWKNANALECLKGVTVSARNKHRTCAYCGKLKKATVDHVPPKLLLEQPFPPNLMTVPACEDCNTSFKKDDEYTRSVLAVDIRANWNYAAQSNMPNIVRSLERPNATGFANYLVSQSNRMNVLAPNGLPVMTIDIDKQRTNSTGWHMMRGLYFRETGKPIPVDAEARLESKAGLTADHPDMLTIARVFHLFQDHRNGATGTAFSYAAAFAGQRSIWLMLLYDYFFWVGSIDARDPSEREAIVPHGRLGSVYAADSEPVLRSPEGSKPHLSSQEYRAAKDGTIV